MNKSHNNDLIYLYSTLSSILFTLLVFSIFFAVVIIKERIVKSSFDKAEQVEIELTFPDSGEEFETVATKEYGGATPNELFGMVDTNRSSENVAESSDRSNVSTITLNRSGDSIRMLRTKENLDLEAPTVGSKANRSSLISGQSSDEIEDLYLAKISSLLHSRWGNPRANDAGKVAIVRFWIYSDGSVDYRLLRGSSDPSFDTRLEELLRQIKQEGVERPDRRLDLEIKFIVKE